MKIYKKQLLKALLIITLITYTSCNDDFLDEKLTTAYNVEDLKTEAGIQLFSTGTQYQVFALDMNSEIPLASTESGTDEFHAGADPSNHIWNSYGTGLKAFVTTSNANTVIANTNWDNLYIGIGDANQLIESAPLVQTSNTALKNTALGEGYFMRAYNYLKLVRQYGAVPLKTTVSKTVEKEFTRQSPEKVLAQVISDFTQAYNLLGNTGAPAKITKDAAAHYLAKAYLTRASEINDSWNSSTKRDDLEKVVSLSNEVIARHPLAANYRDLWNYTTADGANEKLPELILSAQFNANVLTTGGNRQHLYFLSTYDQLNVARRNLAGGRPFSRLAPTRYTFEVFDQINDSRFWKSFQTKSIANQPVTVNAAPLGLFDVTNTILVNRPYPRTTYNIGDLGIIYIVNSISDTRFPFSSERHQTIQYGSLTSKRIYNIFVVNAADKVGLIGARFPSLSKYMDGNRLDLTNIKGSRDVTLARSADTYLFAAEAKIRLAKIGGGTYADALPFINTIRTRAAFKESENRALYADGSAAWTVAGQAGIPISYIPENSYYESNNIDATTTAATTLTITNINSLPVSDEAVISKLAISGDYDRMMCLLLNERARELCGEFHRWEDLSRTKTLVSRAKAYNIEATVNIQDYHNLRPIPQTFLDGIYKEGRPLTAAEKQAMQNPGY